MLYHAIWNSFIQNRLPDSLWVFFQNRLWRDHPIWEIQRRAWKLAQWFNLNEWELLAIEVDERGENAKIVLEEFEDINTLYEKIIRTLRKSPNTIDSWVIEYSWRILDKSFIDLLDYFWFPWGKISSINWKHTLKFRSSNPFKNWKWGDVKLVEWSDIASSRRSLEGSLLDSNRKK